VIEEGESKATAWMEMNFLQVLAQPPYVSRLSKCCPNQPNH
jgi:hypothetical protein